MAVRVKTSIVAAITAEARAEDEAGAETGVEARTETEAIAEANQEAEVQTVAEVVMTNMNMDETDETGRMSEVQADTPVIVTVAQMTASTSQDQARRSPAAAMIRTKEGQERRTENVMEIGTETRRKTRIEVRQKRRKETGTEKETEIEIETEIGKETEREREIETEREIGKERRTKTRTKEEAKREIKMITVHKAAVITATGGDCCLSQAHVKPRNKLYIIALLLNIQWSMIAEEEGERESG